MAQLCALRTHDVRALFSLERLSSAALFQETMVCSLGNKKNPAQNAPPPPCNPISAERCTLASGTTLDTGHHARGAGATNVNVSSESKVPPCAVSVDVFPSVGGERRRVNTGRPNNEAPSRAKAVGSAIEVLHRD